MKCENCLHYEACTFAKQYETVDKCPDFADKDLYIKLPCKVGDTVWVLNRANEPQEMVFDTIDIRCTCVRDYDCMCGSLCSNEQENICQHRFNNDFAEVGKTAFLTREDAEKKLEELKNE